MWARRDVPQNDTRTEDTTSATAIDRAEVFQRVAETHIQDAYRLAGAILGDPAEARDAVHDAFIRAWQRWPSLGDRTNVKPWFRRIIVNECRDRLRRSSRRRTTALDTQPEFRAPDAAQQLLDRLVVEASLPQLKPDDRVVLALRYYHDLKVDDIAKVLDIPSGTVKSRLNHAHSRLRALIERSRLNGESQ
jgi:RNA polymerase sigma-70 factor (ECF subfamily)